MLFILWSAAMALSRALRRMYVCATSPCYGAGTGFMSTGPSAASAYPSMPLLLSCDGDNNNNNNSSSSSSNTKDGRLGVVAEEEEEEEGRDGDVLPAAQPEEIATPLVGKYGYRLGGRVSPGFEAVEREFRRAFALGRRRRAQLCVYVGGEAAVDLWGESEEARAEEGGGKEYDGDSMQIMYSNTKTLAAIAVASLVDKGIMDYEDRITKVWPEFGQNGKGDVRLEDVLRHEAGLSYLEGKVEDNLDLMTENLHKNSMGRLLEREKLHFPKHTKREYHAATQGFILNEIFRRADPQRRTIGEYIEQELKHGLGADVSVGHFDWDAERRYFPVKAWSWNYVWAVSMMPRWLCRRSTATASEVASLRRAKRDPHKAYTQVGLREPKEGKFDTSHRDFVRIEMPAANGLGSARGMARVAAAMANGGEVGGCRLMSQKTWLRMHGGEEEAEDAAQPHPGVSPTNFSRGGVNVFNADPAAPCPSSVRRAGYVGWYGYGGSVLQWHPGLKIGFGFATDLAAWWDKTNSSAARLQEIVVRCARRIEMERGG